MDNYTDDDIIEMFFNSQTSEKAFNILVKKYQKTIYWHVRRMVISHEDADDLTQDVFVKIWKNLRTFQKKAKLYTWIYRIATNETLTFLNRKNKFLFLSFNSVENILSNTLKDDNFFTGNGVELKLQKAILSLPQKQRLVFNMKYYDELKFEEMSEILKTSTGALKASYHIATKKIENYLKKD